MMNDIILWEESTEYSLYSKEYIDSSLSLKSSSSFYSFSDKDVFTKLFHDDDFFREKSEALRILAQEVQDITNMSGIEKEMVISYFNRISKSNIYKNIFRCFNRFMFNSNNHISIECIDINNRDISLIRKQYQKFLKNVSYPEMLYRIMKNERYSKFFFYYIQDFFLDDLYSGSFKQVKDHFFSSIFFLICLSDPFHLENIKFHKK